MHNCNYARDDDFIERFFMGLSVSDNDDGVLLIFFFFLLLGDLICVIKSQGFELYYRPMQAVHNERAPRVVGKCTMHIGGGHSP